MKPPTHTAENDAPRRGGGWDYRICREAIDGDFFFTLREVYYDDEGNPNGWTAEPVDFAGDTWKDVAEGISLASGCIGVAILDLDTMEWIRPGPKSSTRIIPPDLSRPADRNSDATSRDIPPAVSNSRQGGASCA